MRSNRSVAPGPTGWLVLAGVLVSAVYAGLMWQAAEGRPVAPLDDAYIHFQYARQMALGQPWQYNTGEPLSTGATSLLYPGLLSLGYRLGFQADELVWPALLIGAVSLIVSTLLVYWIALELLGGRDAPAPEQPRWVAALGAAAFLLSGAIPWGFLNGMETGLFTALLLSAYYAFLRERTVAVATLLVLASLVRPEGFILAGVAWAVVGLRWLRTRPRPTGDLLILTAAVTLSFLPYGVNILLTGTPVASGAQAKAWIENVPFVPLDIARNIGRMAVFIIERLALGFWASRPWPAPPGLLLLAVAGAAGVWRRGRRDAVLLAAGWTLAGVFLAASLITALWQIGRYQVPFLALLIPFATVGVAGLVRATGSNWRKVAVAGLAVWGLAFVYATVQAWRSYADAVTSIRTQQVALGDEIDRQIAQDSVIAVHDAGAIRYIGGRPIYDMIGLTTQGVADAWRQGSGAIFEAMERAAPRPTHFATYPDVAAVPYLSATSLFGRQLYVTEPLTGRTAGTAGPVQWLVEADWATAAGAGEPQQADIRHIVDSMDPLLALDLADLQDEAAHKLEWSPGRSQPGFPTEAHELTFQTDPGQTVLEGGRLLSAEMTFPVTATPAQPLTLVARLHPQEAGTMRVSVNGRDAGLWRFPATPGRWLETRFPVPAALVEAGKNQIGLSLVDESGTARSIGIYHLWVYQGAEPPLDVPPQQLNVRLGESVVLQGVDLPQTELRPGGTLPLTLYWTAEQPTPVDAKVFVHLLNDAGELATQADQRPMRGTRPPYTWYPGEQLVDPVELVLPQDLAAGRYWLYAGLYDPLTNERLPARTAAGQPLLDARIPLGNVVVGESP